MSQLQALEEHLGLYFGDAGAERIAREIMKIINPNTTVVKLLTLQSIVANAKKEHKRKVSQFEAIEHQIGQFFVDPKDSALRAAEVMMEFTPHIINFTPTLKICKHDIAVSFHQCVTAFCREIIFGIDAVYGIP